MCILVFNHSNVHTLKWSQWCSGL